jgi:hypothetical protein
MAAHTKQKTKKRPFLEGVRAVIQLVVLSSITVGLIVSAVYFLVLPQVFQIAEPTNIVIVSKDLEKSEAVVFVHFAPHLKKSVLSIFNGADRVAVLGGYGQYSIQSLYTLLQLEGKDQHFVRAAFSHALGVIVDEVIVVEGLTKEDVRTKELSTLVTPLLFQQKSGLSWQRRVALLTTARTFRNNETEMAQDVRPSELLRSYPLIIGTDAQECQVAVVNTTRTPKLATGVSQLLETAGAIVVRVANNAVEQDSTVFFVKTSSTACSKVAAKASHLFPYVPEIQENSKISQQYRAELVIMVGKDLGEAVETTNN